jgi:hypothetical protein
MVNNPNIPMCCLMVAIGIVFHFISKLAELETQGIHQTPWEYWRTNPWTSVSVIAGAYFTLALMWSLDQLTYSCSLLLGIAANSAGDKMRAQANVLEDQGMGYMVVEQRKVAIKDIKPTG